MNRDTDQAGQPFLDGLDAGERELILQHARVRRVRAGDRLVHDGAPGDGVFILRDAVVKIVATHGGRPVVLALRGAGELVGELATLDGERRCATVVCVRAGEVAWIDGDAFRTALGQAPQARRRVERLLTRRLRDTSRRCAEHYATGIASRMAARVVELGDRFGTAASDGSIRFDSPLSRAELASWAGGSRESGARALHTLRAAGWVDTERRMLVVRDRAALSRLAAA